MADQPTKPFNRQKPFKRINNDKFLVKTAPDGFGTTCGCHTPADFGEFDKEFEEFIKKKIPVIGTIVTVFNTLRDIIKAAGNVAKVAAAIGAGIVAVATALGGPVAGVAAAAAVALGAAAILAAASALLNTISDVVDSVLKSFFSILARRILPRAVRVIPQWAPVIKGASNSLVTADQVREMEGLCTRSFGNPVDVPFFNWHHWFNWNIQVQPEPEYQNMKSPVADPPNQTGLQGSERPITKDGSFEIQWDAGALFADRSPFLRGFPEGQMPLNDGPMIVGAWQGWPMAGMFVWAAGRWAYDCSRTTTGAQPQMCAMINPAKAVATARWQAHDFKENQTSVPAIEFLFLACKRGGYIDSERINDTDYEFIVDLPPVDAPTAPFPIGHTPEFPHNTIVLRPRLLKDLRVLPFVGSASIQPVITFMPPDDPAKPPTQVKVKVPLTKLGASDEACGFILSLGWFDPNLEQARKVKTCTLTVNGFSGRLQVRDSPAQKLREIFKNEEDGLKKEIRKQIGDIKIIDFTIPIVGNITIHLRQVPLLGALIDGIVAAALSAFIDALVGLLPNEKEEWLLRIGVNGEWRSVFFGDVDSSPVALQAKGFELVRDKLTFNLRLAVGDTLFFAAHGTEFDPVGDIMHSSFSNRVLTLNGRPAPWSQIADPNLDKQIRRELVFQYVLKEMTDTTSSALALGFDNSPLGLVDPDPSTQGATAQSNPVVIKQNIPETPVVRTAPFARAVGDQMILVEDPNKPDYRLRYTLEITDLIKS